MYVLASCRRNADQIKTSFIHIEICKKECGYSLDTSDPPVFKSVPECISFYRKRKIDISGYRLLHPVLRK